MSPEDSDTLAYGEAVARRALRWCRGSWANPNPGLRCAAPWANVSEPFGLRALRVPKPMLQRFHEANRDILVNINGSLVHRDQAGVSYVIRYRYSC